MFQCFLEIIFWCGTVFLVTAALLPLIPKSNLITDTLAHFTLQWAIGAMIALVAGGILRVSGFFYIPLLLSYFVFVFQMVPYLWRRGPVKTKEGATRLKLLQANVLYLDLHTRKLSTHTGPLLELIDREQPDIIMLAEINTPFAETLQGLTDYPYRHINVRNDCGFGMALLSKIPFEEVEEKFQAAPGIPSIFARIKVAGKDVHLVSLHAENPFHQVQERWRDMTLRKLLHYVLHNLHNRDTEFTETAKWVRTAKPESAIIAGDFNITPYAPAFKKLCRDAGLVDARKRRGLMGTYPHWTRTAALRIPIDHLLVTPAVQVATFRLGPDIGSDHLPILSEIYV